MDKVIGGTPRSTDALCTTCRNAHRVVGVNLQTIVICRATPRGDRVYFPVSECSAYDNKRVPSLYDMEQIAWKVESRNRGPAGFVDTTRGLEIVISPPDRDAQSPKPAIAQRKMSD